jgi:hypothetical protein
MLFTLLCISLTVLFVVIDRGPLLPPFSDAFDSIDCHNVSLVSFNDRSGFIDFRFATKPSVEYPPEYLPYFIKISIDTPPTKMRYSGNDITNISRDDRYVQFSLAHTWAGPSTLTAQCLHNAPQSLSGDLSDILNYVPQYSRSDHPGIDSVKFRDVCLEYGKFLYFVQVLGDRPAVSFDDGALRFEMLKWPLNAYIEHKKSNLTRRTCFFVAPLAPAVWKMVVLTMIPLAISVDVNSRGERFPPLFVFRGRVPPEAPGALRLLSAAAPTTISPIMCFETLLMTSTYSRSNPKRITELLELDVGPLRRRLPEQAVNNTLIVVAESMWAPLEQRVKQRFPSFKVVKLGTNDAVETAISTVQPARILVGDHITSLIHMLWLSDKATVVDASPGDLACNPWAKDLAKKAGIRHVNVFASEACQCRTFQCYPDMVNLAWRIDVEAILSAIQAATEGAN